MKAHLQAIHPVLAAKDVAASVQFYRNLGFTRMFQDRPDAPTYAVVAREGCELHLQWADAGQWAPALDRPSYRILVNDVDALYQEFVEGGRVNAASSHGSPWAAPGDTPWGTREFHLRDPGENSLQFYRPR